MSEFERTRDRQLLRRFRAGDREAMAELYRLHSRSVYRFALYVSGDEPAAAEITQDVFVWFIDHADRFDESRGALNGFLMGVARLRFKQRQREGQRWVELHEAAAGVAISESEECDVDLARLRDAVARLPLRYREVVALCDLEEKTYEEAARVLQCPIGTVRSRLFRARALLTKKLVRSKCTV